MKLPLTLTLSSLALGASLAPTVLGARAGAPRVDVPADAYGSYEIDAAHSTIAFKIKHLDVAYQLGRFDKFNGSIELGKDASGVEVQLDMASVDTNNDARDDHLRNADFFSVKEFPDAKFKSTRFEAKDADTFAITGELELHGQKKTVSFDMDFIGARDTGRMGYKAGFYGELEILRRNFGIDTYPDEVLSNEVTLTFAIEANKK